jgi:NADPH-dependent 7-cyano-7-deazaguanine reductase QueF
MPSEEKYKRVSMTLGWAKRVSAGHKSLQNNMKSIIFKRITATHQTTLLRVKSQGIQVGGVGGNVSSENSSDKGLLS